MGIYGRQRAWPLSSERAPEAERMIPAFQDDRVKEPCASGLFMSLTNAAGKWPRRAPTSRFTVAMPLDAGLRFGICCGTDMSGAGCGPIRAEVPVGL